MLPTSDHELRVFSPELHVRATALSSTNLCEEARIRHATSPLATVALGRALNAALLLGGTLKGKQRVGLQFRGSGPLREVYADADGEGNVRGYVLNPLADLPLKEGRFDVGGGLGAGILSVTTDLGVRDQYQGIVELVSGEMALDVAHYLTHSAQIPSIINLGVWVDADGSIGGAAGFLVQALPGATEKSLAELEGNVLGLPPLSQMVRNGMTPHDVVQRVFDGYVYQVLAEGEVRYACRCSRERVERTLVALGAVELRDMAEQDHGAEVKCEFCARLYSFSMAELRDLIGRAEPSRQTAKP